MVTADILIKHASVNSGTAVEMNGVDVTWSWKNNISKKPILGTYDIKETSAEGYENSPIIIRGIIDINNIGTNTMNQDLMVDFATLVSTTPITLVIPTGNLYSGTTTSTSASKLVDSTASFTSNASGKIAINTTDGTYATISAVDSGTILSVDTDIFTSGEGYEIKTALKGRPTAGYVKTGSNTLLNTLSVAVDSADISIATGDEQFGARWNYTMTFTETV